MIGVGPLGSAGPVGGRGPLTWIYQRLAADVSDSTGSLVDSGLAFVVEAGREYHVHVYLKWRTAATTTGLQWCFTDPTSLGTGGDSVQEIDVAASINTRVLRNDQLGAAVAGTGATSAAITHPAEGWCWLKTGAGATGSLKVQFQTEVGASAVTLLAGSELWYRVVR